MTKSRELHRKFDAAFKREAVQLWETRCTGPDRAGRQGAQPPPQPAVEVGRPGGHRARSRAARRVSQQGTPAPAAGERAAQAGGQVRKKKQQRSSRKSRGEVRLHHSPLGRVPHATHVPRPNGQPIVAQVALNPQCTVEHQAGRGRTGSSSNPGHPP